MTNLDLGARKNTLGLTLVELLVVIGIIAILAAIALPNFLEYQTRAKVTKTKGDLRTIAMAVESYAVDWSTYGPVVRGSDGIGGFAHLTTPISYSRYVPPDALGESFYQGQPRPASYELGTGNSGRGAGTYPRDTYMVESDGPDRTDDTEAGYFGFDFLTGSYPWLDLAGSPPQLAAVANLPYDPTNGTLSRGEIIRLGGNKASTPVIAMLYRVLNE